MRLYLPRSISVFRALVLASLSTTILGCTHKDARPESANAAGATGAPAAALTQHDHMSPLEQSWVELGSNAQWIVRTATARTECPNAQVDGKTVLLSSRAKTTGAGQQIKICETSLDRRAKSVTVLGQTHALDFRVIKMIAVLGDTGCRIKAKGDKLDLQNCNSSDSWPFEKILNEQILPLHPDLIVHVGDYHYRESPCPAGNLDCDGAIAGDNVESWQQDFFKPASLALNQANWLFVRGNHEICKRAGPSWFRFLDAHSYQAQCSDESDPVMATVGDVSLVWLDAADDRNIQPSLEKLAKSPTRLAKHAFIFLHRPFLTSGADDEAKVTSHLPLRLLKTHRIDAVITGHKHYFSFNQFQKDPNGEHLPTEIISGNGGTKLLVPKDPASVQEGWTRADSGGAKTETYWNHGFLTLERKGSGWWATEHDVRGKNIFTHSVP